MSNQPQHVDAPRFSRDAVSCFLFILMIAGQLVFALTGKAASAISFPSGVQDTMVFIFTGSGGDVCGAEWIEAEGPITERTPQDFETFLKLVGGGNSVVCDRVFLDSKGGDLVAGLVLGEAIRNHKLSTGVGNQDSCHSACAYSFLGGAKRTATGVSSGFTSSMHPPRSYKQSNKAISKGRCHHLKR
jgi:hypothetical protein